MTNKTQIFLSLLSLVSFAFTTLLGANRVLASEQLSCPEQQRLLLNATEGILYPSESDYPFSYFLFPQVSSLPSPQSFAALTGQRSQIVTQVNFDEFFRQRTRFYPGMSQQQILTARRFRVLEATLRSNYRQLTVYRVGQIQINVYIAGVNGCGLTGLQTVSIET